MATERNQHDPALLEQVMEQRELWKSVHTDRRNKILDNRKSYRGDLPVDIKVNAGESINPRTAFAIIERLSSFFGANPPLHDLEPIDFEDPLQFSQVQYVEDFSYRLLESTDWEWQFFRFAKTGSVTGEGLLRMFEIDGFPFVEAIESPENVIIGYGTDDFSSVDFWSREDKWSPQMVRKTYPNAPLTAEQQQSLTGGVMANIKRTGNRLFGIKQDTYSNVMQRSNKGTPKGFIDRIMYEDDEVTAIVINDRVVRTIDHNFGFAPIYPFRNIFEPGSLVGMSDIEGIQQYINAQHALLSKANDAVADSVYRLLVTNSKSLNKEDLKPNRHRLVRLSASETLEDRTRANAAPIGEIVNFEQRINKMIQDHGFAPEAIFGGMDVSNLSGRAIRLLYVSILALIQAKRLQFTPIYKQIVRDMLSVVRQSGSKEAKAIVGDEEIYFPMKVEYADVLEDRNEEINRAATLRDRKLISKFRARKMAGIRNPQLEDFLMSIEDKQDALSQQELIQTVNQMQGGQQSSPSSAPITTEADNETPGIPAGPGTAGGSNSVSQQGQLNQAAQQQIAQQGV